MTLTADDPRLTAYLLGELAEAERAELDAALAADPALRAELTALGAAADALRAGFAAEAPAALAPEQRAHVLDRAAGAPTLTLLPGAAQPGAPPGAIQPSATELPPPLRGRVGVGGPPPGTPGPRVSGWRRLPWAVAAALFALASVLVIAQALRTPDADLAVRTAPAGAPSTAPGDGRDNGVIQLNYNLADTERDSVGVRVEYSTDGGKQFRSSDQQSQQPASGATALATAPDAAPHAYVTDGVAPAPEAAPAAPDAARLVDLLGGMAAQPAPQPTPAADPAAHVGRHNLPGNLWQTRPPVDAGPRPPRESDPTLTRPPTATTPPATTPPPATLPPPVTSPAPATRGIAEEPYDPEVIRAIIPAPAQPGKAEGRRGEESNKAKLLPAEESRLFIQDSSGNRVIMFHEALEKESKRAEAAGDLKKAAEIRGRLDRLNAGEVKDEEAGGISFNEGEDGDVRARKELLFDNSLQGLDDTPNREAYAPLIENDFIAVADDPLSTFSIDVDTASYSNVRRFLQGGQLPPPDAVRLEELINYFSYAYDVPLGDEPFAANLEVGACPWAPGHRLVRIGLKGKVLDPQLRPAANLVFLLDVSGSMSSHNKLPWVQAAMKMLVNQLEERDRVAIVVYAGASGLVLPSTAAGDRHAILGAIDRLQAGGSTNGGAGIELAYKVAQEQFQKEGTNRVILCTDGDFNVGVSDRGSLQRLIEEKAKSGVFLTVLGFGMGNVQDDRLETLADKGNGHYGYIDSLREAQKMLVDEMGSTLFTIAKDVKIQVEWNPAQVAAFRLIGYENRLLAHQDFNDDTKDAGEIGAGHTVTALYEVVPAQGTPARAPLIDPLRYQRPLELTPAAGSGEIMTLKVRAKAPDGDTSRLWEFPVADEGKELGWASDDYRFAAAAASFGMLLRGSKYSGKTGYEAVAELAGGATGADLHGYRAEFLELVKKAQALDTRTR